MGENDDSGKIIVKILLGDIATHRKVETHCVPVHVGCFPTGVRDVRASRISEAFRLSLKIRFAFRCTFGGLIRLGVSVYKL